MSSRFGAVRALTGNDDADLFRCGLSSFLKQCPLCLTNIAPDLDGYSFEWCCMVKVCAGCQLDDFMARREATCAFCRARCPETDKERLALLQKRVDAKDADAIAVLGNKYFNGSLGLPQDYGRSFVLFQEAAALGSVNAQNSLGFSYVNGYGVRASLSMAVRYWVEAAKGGHYLSRYNLGILERDNGNFDLALAHFSIGAEMGYEDSLTAILGMCVNGFVAKSDYAKALKGYQEAKAEMATESRKAAAR